ncbi:MAG: hypothetical protein ACYCSP_07095 [Acidobacteriaceae bacterium]
MAFPGAARVLAGVFGGDGKITHTGMDIGHGKFIQATTHDHPVIQIGPLDAYWRKLLVVERRVKP